MKVGIINITGYAGAELARILYRHPEVEITSVTGRSAAGQQLNEVFPHLTAMDMWVLWASIALTGVFWAHPSVPVAGTNETSRR